jgi:hypothetical protein
MRSSHGSLRVDLGCGLALAVATALISSCGAGSTQQGATTAGQSAGTSEQGTANGDAHSSNVQPPHKVAGGDIVSDGTTVKRPMRGTGGSEINDDNPGNADSGDSSTAVKPASGQLNPCTLVTSAEAQAIVGEPIETTEEAPLGPTCIYQPKGTKSSITLTVESIDFAKLEPLVHNKIHLAIAGHVAYCGVYGRATTFVLLSRDRVLNVAAPCPVGRRLAETALPRLKAIVLTTAKKQ